jgi:hypothetical protein
MAFLMVASFYSVSFAQLFGTNLEKGDKNFAKANYTKAYDFYNKAAVDYQGRIGKVYSNPETAKADAAKLAEAYYKTGLSIKKLRPKDPAAKAMFEKAAKASQEITQSYYIKEEVKVPAGYVQRWIPATTKQVFVDGKYEDIWKDGGTKQVYVDGYYKTEQVLVDDYKEVWVDPYYKQDGTHVSGYYRKVKSGSHYENRQTFVDGYYKTEQLPGHYEKVWKDGYYQDVVVDAHYEDVFEPAHIEYKDVYKEKKVVIPVTSSYTALAKSQLPKLPAPVTPKPATTVPKANAATAKTNAAGLTSAAAAKAPEAVAAENFAAEPAAANASAANDPAVKAAYDRMNQAYQEFVKAGMPTEGPVFSKYSAALDIYKMALEAAAGNR